MQTLKQDAFLAKLLGYKYIIQYCSGKQNMVVNALSRLHESSLAQAYWILTIPKFHFLDDLRRTLPTHLDFITLSQAI